MLRWAEARTILSVKQVSVSDLHDVLSALEEEETKAMAIVYTKPNSGGITDEDSADEDDGGLIHNISGNQLNAVAEAV